MKTRIMIAVAVLALVALGTGWAQAAGLSGRWNATAEVSGAQIPFRLELVDDGTAVRAHFFDGARPTNPSTAGTFKDGKLHLAFPSYAAVLDATVANGKLDGAYQIGDHAVAIHAIKDDGVPAPVQAAPRIAGEWIIPYRSPKGEAAWRLIIHQTGSSASAAILRIDGDTGTLSGQYANGAFRLSHYAGERAALLEITPQPDRSLKLVLTDGSGRRELTAVTQVKAAALGVAPTDPTRNTTVSDKAKPFRFAFPDLAGRMVANTDPKFRGKVVVVDIMGSWCPNCHDEAPFLQALYARHHKEGLEVVALDFEQNPDQLANPQRLKAFIQRYGLTYTVLLAGETKQLGAKVPQAVNLNAWPTTFFIGRDGRVKGVHSGFTSPGSGARDLQTRQAVEHEVETLLARPKTATKPL